MKARLDFETGFLFVPSRRKISCKFFYQPIHHLRLVGIRIMSRTFYPFQPNTTPFVPFSSTP
ncbi:MAG TPA: hypothetical protein PLL08_04670 [Bacteroidales bacterium]|nr:hypothetical protein [Bacteroidales bacterium]